MKNVSLSPEIQRILIMIMWEIYLDNWHNKNTYPTSIKVHCVVAAQELRKGWGYFAKETI